MDDKPSNGETQETQPAEGESVTIPVPRRKDVLGDLAKVAKPRRSTGDGGAKKKR